MSALTRAPYRFGARLATAWLCVGMVLGWWNILPNTVVRPAAAVALASGPLLAGEADPMPQPIALKTGPYLLLDDYWIGRSYNIVRRVNSPQRHLSGPVVPSGPNSHVSQPYMTVAYDPEMRLFRMWYNGFNPDPAEHYYGPNLAYLESQDGIHWPGPFQRLDSIELTFNASVYDEGGDFAIPAERYKLIYSHILYTFNDFESRAAYSPDGLTWTDYDDNPIFTGPPLGDVHDIYYDPVRQRYGLLIRSREPYTWTNAEGIRQTQRIRLLTQSTSLDFKTWTPPQLIFAPDALDEGVTQSYGLGAVMTRGDLLVGFHKILRNELNAEGLPEEAKVSEDGAGGMGWTVLSWSRDGETWLRDRELFFEPDPEIGAWDHAHAWISSALPVGDEVYLYYAGYRWGHNYRPTEDIQIGLLRMPRDRYVAWQAGAAQGWFETPLVTFDASQIRLNADAQAGEIRVQLSDAYGSPLPGFTFADCQPITVDSLDAPVQCSRSLSEIRNLPVHLEVTLRNASLFAFSVE